MIIGLIGYGKMGKLVEQEALGQGFQVGAIFSREKPTAKALEQIDVAIDFSHGSAVLDHLQACLAAKRPLVIGTTGWEEYLPEARERVLKAQGAALYAPNFSIGFFLFQQMVSYAGTLFQHFEGYDVCGVEWHHKQKADRPSGTAKLLAKTLLQKMPRLQAFEFTSVRCGHMPGTHTLQFDSQSDTLTVTHEARNRLSFAQGALKAAEWLKGKQGFFSLEEMMQEVMKCN